MLSRATMCRKVFKKLSNLQKHSIEKTHDLVKINNACISIDTEFEELSDTAELLSGYAVEIRYPGAFYEYSIEEAREAVERAKMFKSLVLKKLS